jgi:hypothetical protein
VEVDILMIQVDMQDLVSWVDRELKLRVVIVAHLFLLLHHHHHHRISTSTGN